MQLFEEDLKVLRYLYNGPQGFQAIQGATNQPPFVLRKRLERQLNQKLITKKTGPTCLLYELSDEGYVTVSQAGARRVTPAKRSKVGAL